MKKVLSILFILVIPIMFSCSNKIGGILVGFDKEPAGGQLVRLIVVDDEGNELNEVGFTVSDSKGHFDLGINDSVGSSFIVEAILPNGTIRGFATGDGSKTDLNPITDAIVRAVTYVTETEGGRTLIDFSKSEIRHIVRDIEDEDSLWDIDFINTQSLVNAVIDLGGKAISDASGGTVLAASLASVEAPNVVTAGPTFENPSGSTCAIDHYAAQGDNYFFVILQDGSFCNVRTEDKEVNDGYAGSAYTLTIDGDSFVSNASDSFPGATAPYPSTAIEDDREVVFGPELTTAGLSVTRKLYTPDGSDYVRFLEIFNNPTVDDLSVSIEIDGELGIGNPPGSLNPLIDVLFDMNGDLVIDTDDSYAANVNSNGKSSYPTIGYLWDGFGALDTIDSIDIPPRNDVFMAYSWEDIIIPAGSTKAFMHFAFATSNPLNDDLETLIPSLYENPDQTGMSTAELNALQNFRVINGNVSGEAGSVISSIALTVMNETQNESVTTTASRDGSFNVNIDADAGDQLKIIEAAGYETSLVVSE